MLVTEHEKNGLQCAGLIPYFFRDSFEYLGDSPGSLGDLADSMDELYGYGGFSYPFGGTVDTAKKVYVSSYDEDEPLNALLTIEHDGFTLYVFPYAITALVDSEGKQIIGRFD